MPPRLYTTEEISSYLLGIMPSAEADKLEEAYFEDLTLAERVLEIENNLIDDYVRGQLPEHQRAQFERDYLSHPNRRQRVEVASVLLTKLDQLKHSPLATEKKRRWWLPSIKFLQSPQLALTAGMLILVLISGCIYLWNRSNRSHQQTNIAQVAHPIPEQRPSEFGQPPATTQPEAKDQTRKKPEQSFPKPSASSPDASPLAEIPMLILTVGATRGDRGEGRNEETASQFLKITPMNKEIRLSVQMLETDYLSYRAEILLEAGSGETIFSQASRIKLTRRQGVETVTVPVPTTLFKKGIFTYRLQLMGLAPSGQEYPIFPSPFRIEKE